jgi:hypothetical protein
VGRSKIAKKVDKLEKEADKLRKKAEKKGKELQSKASDRIDELSDEISEPDDDKGGKVGHRRLPARRRRRRRRLRPEAQARPGARRGPLGGAPLDLIDQHDHPSGPAIGSAPTCVPGLSGPRASPWRR